MKLLIAVLTASTAFGQVDAPRLGYLPDAGRIRPVLGIPESAIVAPPLAAGPFARIASAGNIVVASSAETGEVMLYRNGAFEPVAASPSPDLIILSPAGSAAVLWYAGRSAAEIVSGLDASPSVRTVPAPFRPSTPPLAVSDDGGWFAGVWPDGLYVFGRDRQPAPIPMQGRVRAIAFRPGSHELLAAASSGVFTIRDIGGSAAATALYTPESTLRPEAIAATSEAVLLAEATGSLVAISANGTRVTDCRCRPGALAPLANGVFRITDLAQGSVKLYDAAQDRVFYAPLSLQEGEAAR